MYPVTSVSGEVSKMEVVQKWHSSYGGLMSERVGVVIQIRERPPKTNPLHPTVAAAASPRPLEQSQFDSLLGIVQIFENEVVKYVTWTRRRKLLGQLRVDLELSDEDWRLAYAMFMARNPSEIPHRREYEKQRRTAETTTAYSGTDKKEGRNWRYPGDVSFSIQGRQRQLFKGWTWPQDHATDAEQVIDVGPHDEEVVVTAEPPRGETWNTILNAQKIARQDPWSEQWQSIWPKYGSPIPDMKDAWNRVSGLPQKAVKAARSVEWTVNGMAILRSQFPNKCGRIHIKKTYAKIRMSPNALLRLHAKEPPENSGCPAPPHMLPTLGSSGRDRIPTFNQLKMTIMSQDPAALSWSSAR